MKQLEDEALAKKGTILLLTVFLCIFAIFLAYPLSLVFLWGFGGERGFSLNYFFEILNTAHYIKVMVFTFEQALLSTAITLLLGFPGAYIFSNFDFRGKSYLLAILTVPFVLPSVLVVLGFVIFFGNTGIVNSILIDTFNLKAPPLQILYSWEAIVLAHAFYNIPLVFRLVSSVWSQIDDNLVDAARGLGASRWQAFLKIELPLMSQAVLSAGMLTFIYSFTSFAIVLALGGVKYTTIEVSIYHIMHIYGKHGLSSALAILQLVFLCVFLWLYLHIRQSSGGRGHKTSGKLSHLSKQAKILVVFYSFFVGALLMGPMISILYASIRRTWMGHTYFTLYWFKQLFLNDIGGFIGATPLEAIGNSIVFATIAVLISVTFAMIISYLLREKFPGRSVVEVVTNLPLGISTVTLALGYIVVQNMVSKDISFWAIGIIHAVISLPFAVRSISSSLSGVDKTLVEAARGLGASRWQAFLKIELPLIKKGIVVAGVFSFAISLGELAAAYMLYGGRYTTIPIYIYRYIGGYRLGSAAAMGVILMAVSAVSFLFIEKMGAKLRF
ncbi:MAG: ABC transporter permease [Candidatus Methanofastidiosia archaeon]